MYFRVIYVNIMNKCKKSLFTLNNFKARKFCTYKNLMVNNIKFQNFNQSRPNINSIRNYVVAAGLATLGLSFAAVPLYKIFCQSTGYGGTVKHDTDAQKIEKMKKNKKRPITVKFVSDVYSNMAWQFKPQQNEIMVYPGETALAFYKAKNPTDRPIIGISTYNVLPFKAGPYFNKIQCFCFEEQLLNPKEEVDMPVFFYIDPEFCEDPQMEFVNEIILSYTFFEAKKGMPLYS